METIRECRFGNEAKEGIPDNRAKGAPFQLRHPPRLSSVSPISEDAPSSKSNQMEESHFVPNGFSALTQLCGSRSENLGSWVEPNSDWWDRVWSAYTRAHSGDFSSQREESESLSLDDFILDSDLWTDAFDADPLDSLEEPSLDEWNGVDFISTDSEAIREEQDHLLDPIDSVSFTNSGSFPVVSAKRKAQTVADTVFTQRKKRRENSQWQSPWQKWKELVKKLDDPNATPEERAAALSAKEKMDHQRNQSKMKNQSIREEYLTALQKIDDENVSPREKQSAEEIVKSYEDKLKINRVRYHQSKINSAVRKSENRKRAIEKLNDPEASESERIAGEAAQEELRRLREESSKRMSRLRKSRLDAVERLLDPNLTMDEEEKAVKAVLALKWSPNYLWHWLNQKRMEGTLENAPEVILCQESVFHPHLVKS